MSDIASRVEGFVHEDTQVHGGGVDMTVAAVHAVTEPGAVDFSGDKLAAGETVALDPEKRDPDDEYGWWVLGHGTHLLEFNETLAPREGERLVVQTRDELLARGAYHPTLHARELDLVPLTAGEGVHLKENARVSTVVGVEKD